MDDFFNHIDHLHEQKAYQQIFEQLTKAKNNTDLSSNIEFLWRYARAYYDLSSEIDVPPKKQEKLLRQGKIYADACLQLDQNNFYSHKWTAVFLSALTEFDGIKNKIDSAFKIKEHCDKANELLGADENGDKIMDGTLEHLIGRWCYRIASISWVERKLAKAIISELPESPEEATYENALRHFINADKLKENFIANALWCAHTYKKLGNMNKAKLWYKKAAKMQITSSSDQNSAKEARKLAAKL